MVRLAPNFFARMAELMFWSSCGLTAMKRSHLSTSASFSAPMEVQDATVERMSSWLSSSANFSSSVSISMMLCSWRLSILAKCVPTEPAPAITMFIILLSMFMGANIVK